MIEKERYKETIEVKERRNVYYTSSDPAELWKDVLTKDLPQIKELCRAMKDLIDNGKYSRAFNILSKLLYTFGYKIFGKFIKERGAQLILRRICGKMNS